MNESKIITEAKIEALEESLKKLGVEDDDFYEEDQSRRDKAWNGWPKEKKEEDGVEST